MITMEVKWHNLLNINRLCHSKCYHLYLGFFIFWSRPAQQHVHCVRRLDTEYHIPTLNLNMLLVSLIPLCPPSFADSLVYSH